MGMVNKLQLALAVVLLAGCSVTSKIKRLDSYERDHFGAVKVWMAEDQELSYLKLKSPTERDAWLKAHTSMLQRAGMKKSLWDTFYQYDQTTRDDIVSGDVQVAWTEDQLLMAWGAPYNRRRVTKRTAVRSEIYIYRFEVTKDGELMVWEPNSRESYQAVDTFQYEIHVDDSVVVEMTKKDQWD
jgi:hypothetical protein